MKALLSQELQKYIDNFESFKSIGVRPYKQVNPIRPITGDYIHMLLKQDIEFSIVGLSPEKYAPYMYSWGKYIGNISATEALKTTHALIPVRILSFLGFYMSMLKWRIFYENFLKGWIFNRSAIPSITNVDKKFKRFEFESEECDEASGLPNIRNKICFYNGAVMAGNIESLINRTVNVTEQKCIANDDGKCLFRAVVDSGFPDLDIPEKSDYDVIKNSIFDKIMQRKKIRSKMDDYTHLAPFQLVYAGIWLSSPGAQTMLYWIGKNSGLQIGKRITENEFEKRAEEFSEILEYLKVGEVEITRDKMIVRESAFAAGTKNFNKKICSYLSGMFSGFLESSNIKRNVIETKCLANGNNHCEFSAV